MQRGRQSHTLSAGMPHGSDQRLRDVQLDFSEGTSGRPSQRDAGNWGIAASIAISALTLPRSRSHCMPARAQRLSVISRKMIATAAKEWRVAQLIDCKLVSHPVM